MRNMGYLNSIYVYQLPIEGLVHGNIPGFEIQNQRPTKMKVGKTKFCCCRRRLDLITMLIAHFEYASFGNLEQ